ncbi:hypothetical protein GCM10023115_28310 [Pontixanthobacter gangjinensis]|uniref:Helix-turn-helix domain-containing protein n=1 Tax=Christiangramia aestuarii TaxID=1028746 RepID=A0A7K1LMV1_9FLAO|nr:helix-turn-helix domain-containing protein [Christiangramia aestuarii]MUP42063.1 helix-turn-helix domain-containing protein [Christiangramia aestuarii]
MDTILFNGVDPQDFKKEILEGVQEYLQDLLAQQKQKEVSDYLTRQQAAKMLSIDLSTLHHWTKGGKLTSYGIGKRVYYKKSGIEEAMVKLD